MRERFSDDGGDRQTDRQTDGRTHTHTHRDDEKVVGSPAKSPRGCVHVEECFASQLGNIRE